MDLRKVKKLLELMETHELAEIEVEAEGEKVRLRKNVATPIHIPAAAPMPVLAAPAAHAVTTPAAAESSSTAQSTDDLVEVVSPMVGTFYRAPSPDAEPFIGVGDKVEEETVVAIIEAMKVMNTIKAEVKGEIVAILVENGEAVEYGQPLFAVKPAV